MKSLRKHREIFHECFINRPAATVPSFGRGYNRGMSSPSLSDASPSKQQFLSDVLAGLGENPKSLPCKYLYDERGSELFTQICELDEYYLTRTEVNIMREHAAEMAECIGPRCVLVEYGSGTSLKTRILLDHLHSPAGYVPVDISKEHLRASAIEMDRLYPDVAVYPVCADFTQPFELPDIARPFERTVGYFPGSTVGNFSPEEASTLLNNIAAEVGAGGGLLIGVDLKKREELLVAAYDDASGVTSDFNLNLLEHINRELDADFELDRFRHLALFNEDRSRMEMYLVSEHEQVVCVDGAEIELDAGERIHTENSHKYTLEEFADIARQGGFDVAHVWCDSENLFSVQYLTVKTAQS